MKNIIFLLLAGFSLSCTSNTIYTIGLENTSSLDRKDAGIVIPFSAIEKQYAENKGLLPIIRDQEGMLIPTQIDDLDGDGQWDELFILADFKGLEKKKCVIQFVEPSEYPVFNTRTNIRFARKDEDYREVKFATRDTNPSNMVSGKKWQMEGIGWENDKIAYRNYFDRRNAMDIYAKITSEMVLDGVGYKNNPSYHKFNPEWGVDVLAVGNSLGAGSIAFLYNDSLYRLGDNGVGTCEVLVEGPLRSIFRFEFSDWKMKDLPLTVIHDVTIEAGKYYFNNSVTYSGSDAELQLVPGIVNIKSHQLYTLDSNDQYLGFYTHDLQAEDTTLLALGVMVSAEDFIKTTETANEGRGIIQSYCVHLKTSVGKPVTYRFYTAWERENEQWKTAEGFAKLLKKEAEYMANPVITHKVYTHKVPNLKK